jgi:RimJ/RimL family protein N-acetyltransferase
MSQYLTHSKHYERIVKWVNDGIPYDTNIDNIVGAFAIEKDGELVGGITLVNSNGINAFIQVRMLTPHQMMRGLIEKTFHHAFVTLKLERLSNSIVGANTASIRLTQGVGFKLEGVLRGVTEKRENVYLSVMRPEFCKFLKV